ncbi:MAG: hypothetical protein K2G15_08215, partial [Muribaculaceae bacterium]|nr:hypothetical protein [Muribaculaceae bacterium]
MPTKLLLALSMLLLAACSGGKKFSVKIDSESLGTQKLTVVYTQPDGHRVLIIGPSGEKVIDILSP